MTSEALRLYEERIEKARVILTSLEDLFYEHLSGAAVANGEQRCSFPEKQADLAFLLIRTGADLAREMASELAGDVR